MPWPEPITEGSPATRELVRLPNSFEAKEPKDEMEAKEQLLERQDPPEKVSNPKKKIGFSMSPTSVKVARAVGFGFGFVSKHGNPENERIPLARQPMHAHTHPHRLGSSLDQPSASCLVALAAIRQPGRGAVGGSQNKGSPVGWSQGNPKGATM